ncbi:MAG: ATP-binding protein [Spirochaetota bacterium]
MLNELFAIQQRIISSVKTDFKRFLFKSINWDNPLIAIVGARGTGKTTLVLQHFLEKYNSIEKCLYISADNPLVLKNGLYDTINDYFKKYGECVIIDEVHKHPDWSIDIKALHDSYPVKKIIISGSSALNILGEKGDLSRRIIVYKLPCMSFREYLNFKFNINLSPISIEELLKNPLTHSHIAMDNISHVLGEFNNYLRYGSYPFFKNYNYDEYVSILSNILDKVVYEDIPAVSKIISSSSLKLKKLIGYIALSTVPVFNIENLTREIEISRDTLYDFFNLLQRAEILNIVKTRSKNVKVMKNSKILFKSPNYYHAIAGEFWKHPLEPGNTREAFFAGSIPENYLLYTSRMVDFEILLPGPKVIEIEVGGKTKSKKQIGNTNNGFIFKDNIETGNDREIPLYLAGFLY